MIQERAGGLVSAIMSSSPSETCHSPITAASTLLGAFLVDNATMAHKKEKGKSSTVITIPPSLLGVGGRNSAEVCNCYTSL